ncbi:unnamed protein product [Didymodactylos carnosus]|uniref:Uncharacterized protein n=1 Tax=Didymodactylos carnosus TaxID=1234261 RepID=A0A8S2XRB9_9BILA|nr:unnamed protein product [Didymodactylos carnosus]CAF4511336.1 unnamed protein product [Didymodactylos carnosus]
MSINKQNLLHESFHSTPLMFSRDLLMKTLSAYNVNLHSRNSTYTSVHSTNPSGILSSSDILGSSPRGCDTTHPSNNTHSQITEQTNNYINDDNDNDDDDDRDSIHSSLSSLTIKFLSDINDLSIINEESLHEQNERQISPFNMSNATADDDDEDEDQKGKQLLFELIRQHLSHHHVLLMTTSDSSSKTNDDNGQKKSKGASSSSSINDQGNIDTYFEKDTSQCRRLYATIAIYSDRTEDRSDSVLSFPRSNGRCMSQRSRYATVQAKKT